MARLEESEQKDLAKLLMRADGTYRNSAGRHLANAVKVTLGPKGPTRTLPLQFSARVEIVMKQGITKRSKHADTPIDAYL
jgi:hypothetical protein